MHIFNIFIHCMQSSGSEPDFNMRIAKNISSAFSILICYDLLILANNATFFETLPSSSSSVLDMPSELLPHPL